MNIKRITMLGLISAVSSHAAAQPFTIESYTIDGGGTLSVGGPFELVGTIGQPDAGSPLAGGGFDVTGGFWAGVGVGGCNAADLAPPFGTLDFTDVISFLIGFGAQEPGADLAPPFGVFDFTDVIAFLSAFGAGCP